VRFRATRSAWEPDSPRGAIATGGRRLVRARFDDDAARGPVATVFVSDPTAEAERVAQALRLGGYAVVDVPLSMLVARVGVQYPRVVLVDADSDGALDVVARVRELPDSERVHVLFIGRPGAAIATPDAAVGHGGSGLFLRPVDIPSMVKKVDALTGGPRAGSASILPAPRANIPLPPPSVPRLPGEGSLPPPGERAGERRSIAPPVGADLQQLLAEAELRVQVRSVTESSVPSPEDEIEAVLPAELLASLDEPLEADDDEDDAAPARSMMGAPPGRDRTVDGSVPRTTGISTGGGGQVSTGDGAAAEPPNTHGGTHTGPTGGGAPTTGESVTGEVDTGDVRAPPSMAAPASVPAQDRLPPAYGDGEAVSLVARAIAARHSGSLCFASGAVERRLILREGDVVTCASSAEDESLVAFLGARGELPRETVRRFGSKLPPFGRHAGAALVARGYLGQDQMWPTLRAHAEWVLVHLMGASEGRLAVEPQAPGRLGAEPGVLGGATGAEVFVDLVRRTVAPADAVERLGGAGSRIAAGRRPHLLGECALDPVDVAHVREATGKTLREVIERSPEGDLATVVFALVQLGVLEIVRAAEAVADDADGHPGAAAIDADAVRERVRARSQIVDDGDYFAVLGVAHDATGYEVRRAFLELRRAFDPSRMLTPEVADLAGDVRKITVVLEEAYEILKDPARRERYRRAIDDAPAGD
jgi:hypothetical protein